MMCRYNTGRPLINSCLLIDSLLTPQGNRFSSNSLLHGTNIDPFLHEF
jgi:hypothetical protein